MFLKLNNQFSLNIGEDLQFICNFIKGKNDKSFLKYRPLFRGVKTGKEYLLVLLKDKHLGIEINFLQDDSRILIPKKQLKFRVYNYYYLDNDFSKINKIFTEWKESNPVIQGDKISEIPNYTWAYQFNGKRY